MDTNQQKILLTGVTGLVGERLLPRLVEAGYNCTALVRQGKKVPIGIKSVEGDLFDPSSLIEAVKNVTTIVHLAAVFRSQDNDLIWKSNLEGTKNLLKAVKDQTPEARFIMASTSNVYNQNNPHPGREDDVVDPQLAYPASKIAAEKELSQSGLNWAVLRFPFVYGDGDGHLGDFPKHILGKWHPAQRMSTIHHRDIFTGMQMAIDGKFDRRIINICDEAPTSAYELVKLVGIEMDSSSEPLSNPWYLHIDGGLARSLGFKPTVRTVYQAIQEDLM